MCEQSRVYGDGDIVWVKLSNCWWPGEVHDDARLPPDMVSAFRKKRPHAIVKFFQEDSYEYVKNERNIYQYRCDRRLDFIRKGLDLYQANHKYMEMFPADVATAERRTKGDPDIINNPAVLNPAKQSSSSKKWAEIFGGDSTPSKKTAATAASPLNTPKLAATTTVASPVRAAKEHEVRILSSSSSATPSPIGRTDAAAQLYKCRLCTFSSGRMNLLILHSKSHNNDSADSRLAAAGRSPMTPSSTPPSRATKRSSTASSSTPSPALSPVSSRAATPPPPPAVACPPTPPPANNSRKTTPVANKSRPPKKRTKRVPSVEATPSPPPPAKSAASPAAAASSTAKSTTPPPDSPPPATKRESRRKRIKREESPEGQSPAVAEEEKPTSPAKPLPETPSKNVDLQNALLKDWSEDEDEAVVEQSKPQTAEQKQQQILSKAAAVEEKTKVAVERTSSPIRCRNIPKKDRRDVVFEEFEPKTSPNRTGSGGGAVTDQPMSSPEKEEKVEEKKGAAEEVKVVVEEVELKGEDEPIVQKKKRAAIERLHQTQEDVVVPTSELPPSVAAPEERKEVATEENNNRTATSCFDFEEDPPVGATSGGSPAPPVISETKTAKVVEANNQVDEAAIEQKDKELLTQIGNILNSTSEYALGDTSSKLINSVDAGKPADKSVNNTKLLSDISLPPKERGKRIFKSRNINKPEEEVPGAAVVVVPEAGHNERAIGEEPQKQDEPSEIKDSSSQAEEVADSKIVQVPRKRKFGQQIVVEEKQMVGEVKTKAPSVAVTAGEDKAADEIEVVPDPPEKRVKLDPSPDPIEEALKHVCEEEKVQAVPLAATTVEEIITTAAAAAADKPKINNGSSCNTTAAVAQKSPLSVESSPIKTNDVLAAATKGSVQKVQIVQRVRATDGSEMTETKVAKISTADSANVLTVAITTAPPDSSEPLTYNITESEAAPPPAAVNGSAHRTVQESPSKDESKKTSATTTPVSSTTPLPARSSSPVTEVNVSSQDSSISDQTQLLAIPGETFGGPANSFYLCTVDEGNFIPIDNQPLYLDACNQLVPTPPTPVETIVVVQEEVEEEEGEEAMDQGGLIEEDGEEEEDGSTITQIVIGPDEQVVDLTDPEQKFILTTGNGQEILLDLQDLCLIASGGEAPRLVLPDGQEMVIDGTPQEILSSIRISPTSQAELEYEEQQPSHDILGAALIDAGAPIVYGNVSTAYVSETNAVLTQPPIMSTLEVPSKAKAGGQAAIEMKGDRVAIGDVCVVDGSTNLEDSLAVIGVPKATSKTIPASLELPITITNPKIVAKTTQASIKSVYMTTASVCSGKVEPVVAAECWTGTAVAGTIEGLHGANGIVREIAEEEEHIMVVVGEGEDGEPGEATVAGEEDNSQEELAIVANDGAAAGETAIMFTEVTE